MGDIVLSAGVRQNLLSLQSTAELMATTQNRLATGKRVNSALDNPSNFFTSQALSYRAGDLNSLLDSIGQAQKTIEAADHGITAITKLVESAKSIAKQAQQTAEPDATYALGVTGSVTLTDPLVNGLTGTLTVQVGSGAVQTINLTGLTSVADLTTALGGLTGVTATVNGSNQISITSTTSDIVTIGGSDAAALVGAASVGVHTPTASVASPNSVRANLQSQFNEILVQIDSLARDASYNGVNLLGGDGLKVVFNEDGSSSLEINGVDFDTAGLGLTALSGDEFQTNLTTDAVLVNVDQALRTLRAQASAFGSKLSTVQIRQDFTKNLVRTLETGADNLVLADTNEEGANMLALQTRQQLSTTALSLSAQADQAVLRLFG
ncbi:flagellin [Pseudorhodoplanes sp.]|uniref:flagellin N-terminal helical domain-containing protein n=1 Tax=Pseudorhodoplanes sp. TaxID=1934341 RepID=UPI003D128D8D